MDKRVLFSGAYFTVGTSSSSGDCALIGALKVDIGKVYIRENERELKNDIVRGDGEFLKSMAHIFNCSPKNAPSLFSTLKLNYESLIDGQQHLSSEAISKEAENICSLSSAT